MTIFSLIAQIVIIIIVQIVLEFFKVSSALSLVSAELKRMKAQYPFVVNEYGKKWTFDQIDATQSLKNEWKWYINKEESLAFISFFMMHLGVFIVITIIVNLILVSVGLSLMNVIAGALHIAGPTNDFIILLSFLIPIGWQYLTLRRIAKTKHIEDNKFILLCHNTLDTIQKAVDDEGLDVDNNRKFVTITSTARKV